MKKIAALVLMVVFASIIAQGSGLKCYTCTSSPLQPDAACEKGVVSSMQTMDCLSSLSYCSVSKMEIPSTSGFSGSFFGASTAITVSRNCWSGDSSGGLPGLWQFCQSDLCNSGPRILASLPILYVVIPLSIVVLQLL